MFDTNQAAFQEFRNIVAERTSSVVAWVGAGLSQAAGLPSWKKLKETLCDALESKAQTMMVGERDRLLRRLDSATQQKNYWVAFDILKESLGPTSYRAEIRRALAPAESASVPEVYKDLWSLRLSGVLNLNLDRLATRAHSENAPCKNLNEFSGKEAGHYVHLLKSPDPFVINLHGICANESSWVLTNSDLKRLLSNPGYRSFVSACLMTRTVLFVGLTVDDLAVGGQLAALRTLGIEPGSHFWLTHRTDQDTDSWAEAMGIRVIRYRAAGDNHDDIRGFIQDITSYLPEETIAPPVVPSPRLSGEHSLPEPNELVTQNSEDIRLVLNSRAVELLKNSDQDAYDAYERFCKKYDSAIYRAWYVTTEPPDNTLLGFTIESSIARGAFGHVYRAKAPNGDTVAIKVLHGEIRRNPEMLQSFRRGVRSMEILATSDVTGMIQYREASEIPAFVVMDFVDGPNLSEAVALHYLDNWSSVLRAAVDLSGTIRQSHMLPERVLHRDIRPANIMLRDYYRDPDKWEMVVLDFDLSWHRGASEVSVITTEGVNGFLAPEQVRRSGTASTRNAAVDSFGVGMTLYFLRTGIEPFFAQHKHRTWEEDLERAITRHECHTWRSIPRRFARVIKCATRDAQAERWDMSQICGELERLREAEANPSQVVSAELLAEELVARSRLGSRYHWNPDSLGCVVELQSGFKAAVKALETEHKVCVELSWLRTGDQERRQIKKWIEPACDQSASALRKGGWRVFSNHDADQVRITGELQANALRRRIAEAAVALDGAVEALSFS